MFGVQRIGRYEVLNHLASGGMGQVYLARATGLGGFERQVVVKTLDLSVADDDDDDDGDTFVTMFLDEARLVGALHHQYIAPVYEVGCDEAGRYFIVMDYVHGETAEAVFRVASERKQHVPLAVSLTVTSCVASALEYAHGLCAADGTPLDIVHRDVSLSNVMCGHDGAVKLIDFGIAKAANRATKTQVGTLKGKIGYLAPEQILRASVDHRADIFALGIVLYELTTGERAFRDNSDLITLERITNGEIRRPSEVVPGYPAELERIVMKALETDPARRYQNAGSLGRALEAYAAATGIPLGHAAIAQAMRSLFGDRRGRRRMARGSNDVTTDPSLTALETEDEKTPITDVVETNTLTIESETITRDVAMAPPDAQRFGRSQRPTTPIVERKPPALRRASSQQHAQAQLETASQAAIALEDLPTPIADPGLAMRVRNAHIPLEDRPTPIADTPLPLPLPPERPTPPQRPSQPRTTQQGTGAQRPPKIPTGPQLPVEMQQADPRRPTKVPTGPQLPVEMQQARRPAKVPTGPQLPVEMQHADPRRPAKIPTGPQLPAELEDAPTEIGSTLHEREDPTDVTGQQVRVRFTSGSHPVHRPGSGPQPAERHRSGLQPAERHTTGTAQIVWPPTLPDPATRTWLLLCGLFALAVVVAIVVAML